MKSKSLKTPVYIYESEFFCSSAWVKYWSNDIDNITVGDLKRLRAVSNHVTIKDTSNDLPITVCDRTIIESAINLFEQLRVGDTLVDFFNQSITLNSITLPSLFGEGSAVCNRGYVFNETNILHFIDDNLSFLVFQTRRVIDVIYFPSLGLYVGVSLDSVKKIVQGFVSDFVRRMNEAIEMSFNSGGFLGLFVSQKLPYHYFYDVLPGFHWLYENTELLSKLRKIYSYSGGSWISLKDFYKYSLHENTIDFGYGKVLFCQGFFLSSLRNEYYKRNSLLDRCDSYLLNRCDNVVSQAASLQFKVNEARKFDKLVWMGLLFGKREWIEQVDCFIEICQRLKHQYKNIGFVFDGLTMPVNYDDKINDTIVGGRHGWEIERIITDAGLDRSSVFIIHGSQPHEKIAFAKMINYFITDSLTSSIYVARFAKKHGLTHHSPDARIKGHKHPNTEFIPSDLVKLQSADCGRDWQHANYSIEPKQVADLFLKSFNQKFD